jgi:hypothetical protein
MKTPRRIAASVISPPYGVSSETGLAEASGEDAPPPVAWPASA